mgnify:CR=1 FL=1
MGDDIETLVLSYVTAHQDSDAWEVANGIGVSMPRAGRFLDRLLAKGTIEFRPAGTYTTASRYRLREKNTNV